MVKYDVLLREMFSQVTCHYIYYNELYNVLLLVETKINIASSDSHNTTAVNSFEYILAVYNILEWCGSCTLVRCFRL
jgi:hypothetical protein